MNDWIQTPKALANTSPAVGAQRQPWPNEDNAKCASDNFDRSARDAGVGAGAKGLVSCLCGGRGEGDESIVSKTGADSIIVAIVVSAKAQQNALTASGNSVA